MKRTATVLLLGILFGISSNSFAQTTYQSDPGFFTPVVKSLYLRGGVFEDARLIGPAVGYRFNETYDVTVHTEFLSNEYKFNNSPNPKTTLLNLGVILGRTATLSERFLLRSEVSLYQSIVFKTEGYGEVPEPSLTSGIISSSLYRTLPLSSSISLLPNVGAFFGYGDYTPAYSSASLRQAFDGFVLGPKVGFDVSFRLSKGFLIVASPEYRLRYNAKTENSEGTLLFNIRLNF